MGTPRSSTVSELAKAAQDAAHRELMSDLQWMVNEDDSSDVIFICKDGKRVKAIRSLLIGRCKMLKGMLANGMKETSISEIDLPGVSSPALLCVFEFLYTGTIVRYRPCTPRLQFEALLAGHFFLLPNLVDILKGILHDELLEVVKDLTTAAVTLTLTLEFAPSLPETEGHAIITELVECLSSDWTHSVYAASLSEGALHCLISHSKAANPKEEQSGERSTSLTEYYRFRQIILWWVYQNKSGWSRAVEEAVESAVPIIRYTSCLYMDVGVRDETSGTKSAFQLNSWLTDPDSRDSAFVRLLALIDLRYIHPLLIANVVEPLDCFSPSDTARAFRFHALNQQRKSLTFENATCDWKKGKFLTICDDGSTISNYRELEGRDMGWANVVLRTSNTEVSHLWRFVCDTGSAIALMRMSGTKRIHLWRFVVEELEISKRSIIEVGFVSTVLDEVPVSHWDTSSLVKMNLSSLPGARMLRTNYWNNRTTINWQDEGRCQWKPLNTTIRKGSCILFQLDFKDHICSLNLDGQDLGVCWKNLPDGIFYPAICIGNSKKKAHFGRARIRIQTANVADADSVSDFD